MLTATVVWPASSLCIDLAVCNLMEGNMLGLTACPKQPCPLTMSQQICAPKWECCCHSGSSKAIRCAVPQHLHVLQCCMLVRTVAWPVRPQNQNVAGCGHHIRLFAYTSDAHTHQDVGIRSRLFTLGCSHQDVHIHIRLFKSRCSHTHHIVHIKHQAVHIHVRLFTSGCFT